MTTEEKVVAIENSGFKLAFDGCHKIYFLADKAAREGAAECGYKPFYPSSKLRELIARSCWLVFVAGWNAASSRSG